MLSSDSFEFTPTWVVALVCFFIVLISLCVEHALHRLGKYLKHRKQHTLFSALLKLKDELMLLGFISLLLTVFQKTISHICISPHLATHMLPCSKKTTTHEKYVHARHLLSSEETGIQHCAKKGKVPLLSLEALHHLHIFIFVLAVVHVVFCATTMLLGGIKIQEWKKWEDSIKDEPRSSGKGRANPIRHFLSFVNNRALGHWRKAAVVSWLMSFFKQFYGSVTESDYIALRQGFVMAHSPRDPMFDFHRYMMRTLEVDFKKVVSIRWYMWLFVVIFLLLNVEGWNTYFWLAFLPLVLLLLVGAKLEHIIMRLAQEFDHEKEQVNPSDRYFWFKNPRLVLHLIHFILFQNAFEISFFFWILCTYGFKSCMLEGVSQVIPRLVIGVIIQVMCSHSTLPLYALVTQMGSKFNKKLFRDCVKNLVEISHEATKSKGNTSKPDKENSEEMNKLESQVSQETIIVQAETTTTDRSLLSTSTMYPAITLSFSSGKNITTMKQNKKELTSRAKYQSAFLQQIVSIFFYFFCIIFCSYIDQTYWMVIPGLNKSNFIHITNTFSQVHVAIMIL